MSDIVGTPRRVTLDGTTFDVMGDANFSQIKGKFTNESVPTSGRNIQKKTVRSQNVESVNLQCNGEEAEILRFLNDQITSFPMSYQTASGDVFRAVGSINFESHDTESGVAVLQLMPDSSDGFALF